MAREEDHRSLMCFFFNDTATTEIYTLSLHDALPISLFPLPCQTCFFPISGSHRWQRALCLGLLLPVSRFPGVPFKALIHFERSEEHTSELQSRQYLVCRLLLEKKKQTNHPTSHHYSL